MLKEAVEMWQARIVKEELMVSRRGISNEPRDVAIYLTRRIRGDSLEGIGKEFKIENYSSVSTVIERIKKKVSRDRNLRKRVILLEDKMKLPAVRLRRTGYQSGIAPKPNPPFHPP